MFFMYFSLGIFIFGFFFGLLIVLSNFSFLYYVNLLDVGIFFYNKEWCIKYIIEI